MTPTSAFRLIAVYTLCFSGLSAVSSTAETAQPIRERLAFNSEWRFQKDDPAGVTDSLDYPLIKQWLLPCGAPFTNDSAAKFQRPEGNLGGDIPYVKRDFSDASWRKVTLPHDWGIEGPFQQSLPGDTGKLPWAGIGWYRKAFKLPVTDAGRRIYLDVDGAMAYSMVWCNGQFVGGWPYGYSSFRLDLTSYVKPGQDNQLAIRLRNPAQSSRWYPGSGLYRNVWLVKTNPVHIGQWGTYITTPEVSSDSATVQIRTWIESDSPEIKIGTEIYELSPDWRRSANPVAKISADEAEIPDKQAIQTSQLKIAQPKLWSCQEPNMYVAVTTLFAKGKMVDRYETNFGIRTLKFTADNGFLLNGKRVPIKGVCNHHDLGALGAAFNARAAQRQLEIMKEMGVNALRTSHNPPAPELLDLCDRMGILVMDESFDCWKRGKKESDYHLLWDEWHEKDLRAEYRRDRNHPSIIMWSVGNEVLELGKSDEGPAIAASLTAIAHEEDPTRPTVLGANNGAASFNGVQKGVDVMGQNYHAGGYERFRAENPTIPLIGSETASTVSSRGEYFFQSEAAYASQVEAAAKKAAAKGEAAPSPAPYCPVPEAKGEGKSDFQVSSYDLYAPGWAYPPDNEFVKQAQNPFVCGEFVWTGFDYLGEPTPYDRDTTNLLNFHDPESQAEMARQLKELGKIQVPSRSSYFGIVDLAGFKKDRFYLYQAHWRPELPMAHILPHWNWPERLGKVTPVHVYTSGDEAELFLNGKSLGRKKKEALDYRLRWNDVIYQRGELKVVAYREGKLWAQDVVRTSGSANKLTLRPDRKAITGDGLDLSFVTVTVADKEGLLVPRSKNQIEFSISGPGEIVAVDNGDATSFEPFQASRRKAYNGLALVIVRGTKAGGTVQLKASSEGLTPAVTTINLK